MLKPPSPLVKVVKQRYARAIVRAVYAVCGAGDAAGIWSGRCDVWCLGRGLEGWMV